MSEATSQIRELFIEELAEVHGGGPVEELIDKLGGNTTHACCEEGPDGCCADG
ncbi:MAG: hypothetical protein M3N53_12815 [Actinomycetota bacterium]|nr:hypothetical protein [Actinomycetota bacterium]